MKILLIGPQGSGKSTQGKLLERKFQIPYISTGDIFRTIALQDTDEGKRIKQILDAGELVDDKTTVGLIRQRIGVSDSQNGFILRSKTVPERREGFILDGYPRNLEQAKEVADLNFDKAFYLKIPREIVLERLLKRGRKDDTEDLIKKRLDLYYLQTQPLLDYYKNQGILVEVDGTGDIQTIQDEIKKFI